MSVSFTSPASHSSRARGFTLVEVMVVVVIIGLLAAMSLPTYRHITIRSKATAVENDLRAFSTAFITYNLQNGKWPGDEDPHVVPVEMASALPTNFVLKTAMGGYYKWCFPTAPGTSDGVACKTAISIVGDADSPLNDDEDLRLLIDKQLDDGDLHTGNIQVGSTGSLVFIIEK
jgi:type II secretion system protein G